MKFVLDVDSSSTEIPPAVRMAAMVISGSVSFMLKDIWPGPVTDARLNLEVNGIKLAFRLER